MRSAAMLVIFVFALLIIVAIYLSNSLFILHRYAIVDSLEGSAQLLVRGRGDPVLVQAGKLVRAGDVLETAPGSSVDLRWVRWAGGMRIRIGEKTRFKVVRALVNRSTKAEESRLRVDFGKIWVRLRKRLTGQSKFEVETPTVVAAVRGTVFSVAHSEDGLTEIQVYEGQVTLSGGRGAATTLTSGSQTSVASDQPSLETYPLGPRELEAWEAQTGIIGPFVEVTSPADGVAVEVRSVSVTGRVEAGTQVLINGGVVPVSQDNEFAHTLALERGINAIVVAARDDAGRETTVLLTVPCLPPGRE